MVRDDAERGSYGPHFEPHIMYPMALMGLALAFVFGLSNIFPERFRVIARSIAILVPFGVFMLLRPGNKFATVDPVQLSTSQWIAVLTGIAAAAYYRRGLDLAIADPTRAQDLGAGVPELIEMEAALERGEEWPPKGSVEETEETEETEEAPKKPAAKKVTVVDDDDDDAPASSKKVVAAPADEVSKEEVAKTTPERPSAKVKTEAKVDSKADSKADSKSGDDEAAT